MYLFSSWNQSQRWADTAINDISISGADYLVSTNESGIVWLKKYGTWLEVYLNNSDKFEVRRISKKDTLIELFASEDCKTYADFLVNQPLLFLKEIKSKNGVKEIAMVHAGIPPNLNFDQCLKLNSLFQNSLKKDPKKTLKRVFDKSPPIFKANFKKNEKISYFSNALTRIRTVSYTHLTLPTNRKV